MDKVSVVVGKNTFIPRYSQPDARSRSKESVVRYEDGELKSIYLESISEIHTPIGILPAEYITFYRNEKIHRVFPVYGQISGFWTEVEEKELLTKSTVKIGDTLYSGMFSCICFYETGEVKSLTIWPGEHLDVDTTYGKIVVRYGISFYKDGKMQSLEPEKSTVIEHRTGTYIAHNPLAIGVTGDDNSLCFDEEGKVVKLTTVLTGIRCIPSNGEPEFELKAKLMLSPYDIMEDILIPVEVTFEKEGISFTDSYKVTRFYSYSRYSLCAYQERDNIPYMCSGDCSGCNGGCH
nr:hypothetical protein [uncultured Anaerosporobacter sp.]